MLSTHLGDHVGVREIVVIGEESTTTSLLNQDNPEKQPINICSDTYR